MVYFTTTLTVIVASLGQSQAEFYHDFRSGTMHPALSLFGPDATRVARFEPRGLRINLPAKRENSQPVGVSPQFRVAGDFEITATYELLAADPGSFGAGVNLRVMAGAPMREAADLARFC